MRLIMMGTGPFAVPTFQQLYEARHDVALLVTKPLRSHRGKEVQPVRRNARDVAHEHATPIYEPESVNTPEAQQRLTEAGGDLMVVCDYGQISPRRRLPRPGWAASICMGRCCPSTAGRADQLGLVQRRDGNGRNRDPHDAANRCRAVHRPGGRDAIGSEETAAELEPRLAEIGAWLVRRAIDAVAEGRLEALPQNAALASKRRG